MSHAKELQLDKSACDCLEYISHHRVQTSNLAYHPGCNIQIVQHLESLGLIERAYDLLLPLEMARMYYRVTVSGTRVMELYLADKIKSGNRR